MSLVVAQLTNNGPRIVSDTWVSFPFESNLNSKMGTLKSVIVTPEIAICFAGSINKGLKGVRRFAEGIKSNQTIDELLPYLTDLSLEGETSSDYIIASTKSNTKLIRIHNGRIEKGLEVAWIGDQEGFRRFQEVREKLLNDENRRSLLSFLPESDRILSVLVDAMLVVIEDTKIESTDGFCVSIGSEESKFNYLGSTFIHVGRDLEIRPGDDLISKMAQPVSDGGYTVSIVEPAFPGTPALCLNFPRAKMGMVYLPLEYDDVQIIKNISPKDFSKAVFEYYGIVIKDPSLR